VLSDLGISHSTITRYKHDLGVIYRSSRVLTGEQKSDIQLKAAYSKRANRVFKQNLAEIASSTQTSNDFAQRALKLKQSSIRNRNQFIQQLSGNGREEASGPLRVAFATTLRRTVEYIVRKLSLYFPNAQ
jgi:lysophospholipase L1-like esterase